MKHILLFLVALIVACGAADEVEQSDIGKLEQAIYADDGYGFDGAGKRCWSPDGWAGGECSAPDAKGWQFYLPANVTGTPGAAYGCTPTQINNITTAMDKFKELMNPPNNNWNITSCKFPACFSSQTTAGGTFKVKVSCNNTPTGGTNCSTPCAETQVNRGLNFSCEGNSPWEFCQFKSVDWVRLYPNRVSNIVGWAGWSASKRNRVTAQVMLHEFYHVVGLGHDTKEESPLMGGSIDPNGWVLPTEWEQLALWRYNHTSGTNPVP